MLHLGSQDVLAIITKYIRLTAEPVQGRFRTLVLDVKHGIQAGVLAPSSASRRLCPGNWQRYTHHFFQFKVK